MYQLKSGGQKVLKMLHLLCMVMWIGAGITMIMLLFLSDPKTGGELYMRSAILKLVDDLILVPGAVGCLLTGLIYSLFTRWGFFRHRWVAFKWIMTVAQILFGTFVLGPWINLNAELAAQLGDAALQDPVFLHNLKMSKTWGTLQVALLLPYIIVSVKKPWKRSAQHS